MFNNLANYLLGYTSQEPAVPERDLDVRLTAVMADDEDDWVLVDKNRGDRDSEGDTDVTSSLESIPDAVQMLPPLQYESHHPLTLRLTRTSSASSLPCTNIEESWFITPPPCFTSAGPVNMETSPLENLLIEHPSMSVYQHSAQPAIITRRHNSAPSSSSQSSNEEIDDREELIEVRVEERVAVRHRSRRAPVDTIRQQERQCLKIKNAQKVRIFIVRKEKKTKCELYILLL